MNYEQARHLKGRVIQYLNQDGEWTIGKIVEVKKDGFEIEELQSSITDDGYGFGFFGPPFFGPPVFVPFVAFGFFGPPLFF